MSISWYFSCVHLFLLYISKSRRKNIIYLVLRVSWFSTHNSNYKPYHKLDNEISCIHENSNHPPSILKQISTSIEKRISNLSSYETKFNESKEIYQKALKKSGYWQTLKYLPSNVNVNKSKQNRKQNVIWFNHPFSVSAKKKVGNNFLNLTRKYFLPRRKFSKLFNCNTIKVSYSCMPNMKAKINKHKNTLEKAQQKHPDTHLCYCTNKKQWSLNGQCLTESIVYQANITANIPGYKEKV